MSNRADRKKNVAKVAKVIIKDPLKTQREIAKETWVSLGTANSAKREVEQSWTKDDRIVGLTEDDFDIVRLAQGIIKDKLEDKKQVAKMKVTDVSSVARDSAQRYTIFRWPVTNNEWGLKDIRTMSDDELVEFLLKAKR